MKKNNLGQNLWNRATEVIPGGNGLLSKRPDRYLPKNWPTYYSSCHGVEVYDLEGNKFIDMAQMAVGSAILGYSNKELVKAVNKASHNGVNCTLNSPEEVYLAEKLLKLNPFAGGVKFAKTGAEAMSIAIRIARAYTNKDKVAFSGYHGWSDWYMATNLARADNLNNHLLPGLSTQGVPKGLRNTVVPFIYNSLDDFKKVIKENPDVGIICIEGARFEYPNKDFMKIIMDTAKAKNIIIVSDEITSGWRVTDGGVYKINDFKPDIVVYGKGLGGGYAISAVLGRKKIMEVANNTFISSTMFTERIGFVAALKTIEILCENNVWDHLIKVGRIIGESWLNLAKKYNLNITINEFKPLISLKFHYNDKNNLINTIFVQEMLKRGYIASTSIYVSYAHNEKIVEKYISKVDEVFQLISIAIDNNRLDSLLETQERTDAFGRLTK